MEHIVYWGRPLRFSCSHVSGYKRRGTTLVLHYWTDLTFHVIISISFGEREC